MQSIKTKVILLISVLLIISGILLSYITFRSTMNLTMSIAGDRVKIAAEKACEQINIEDFVKIMNEVKKDPSNEENQKRITEMPEYIAVREKLVSIREAGGLRYIYTMIETSDKKYMYIVDGSPDEDISNPGVIEAQYYPSIAGVFQTNQTAISEIDQSEKWGATLSAYVPIRDASGKTIAIVGADYNAISIDNAINDTKKLIIGLVLVCLAASIFVGTIFSRKLTEPLSILEHHIHFIAEGDLTKKLELKSKDELGRLAIVINTMINNLYQLVKEISQTAEQVAASSQELTSNAEQSAQSANRIAVSISNTEEGTRRQSLSVDNAVSVIEQVSAGIQQLASSAREVAEMSGKSANAAKEGRNSIEIAQSQMANIGDVVNNSAQLVVKLGERSKEIGQIVDTISSIAGQTNLLALNAAIEAARAGEQGRGFSVVAEEVRKLAEQCQEAAKQIASLIGGIQTDTDKAVLAMNEGTYEVKRGNEVISETIIKFEEIVALVDKVSNTMQETTAAADQMASGSQQIVASVKDIDKISKEILGQAQTVAAATEEQTESTEQIVEGSQSLAKMSEDLQRAIQKFKI